MSRLNPAKQHALGLADIRQGIRLVKRGEEAVRAAQKAASARLKATKETEQGQGLGATTDGVRGATSHRVGGLT